MNKTNKNIEGFTLHSTDSKLEFLHNDSSKSILNFRTKEKYCTAQRTFISAIDTINHILIIFVTVYIVYHAAKEYSILNTHIILCTIGYVLLMSEAIVILANDNVLTVFSSRCVNKHLHWILQIIGLILNLIGVIVMYNIKSVHFLSIHGITGITSLVMICIVTIFGYPVWIAWKLRKFRPVIIKFIHNFMGISGFVIGIISQCYGYKKSWIHHVTNIEYVDIILLILTILIMVLSLRGALSSLYWQTVDCLKLICS